MVIDAVTGEVLGHAIPPPCGEAFASLGMYGLEGPLDMWVQQFSNAVAWFNQMGYSTDAIAYANVSEVKRHIQSIETAVFFEVGHGNSTGFYISGDTAIWDSDVESWIADYPKMPFTFLLSCDSMCQVGYPSLSYAFRKGASTGTVTIGCCGLCDNFSAWWDELIWQDIFFNLTSQSHTVGDAFDLAGMSVQTTREAMRIAGDSNLKLVPKVNRCPSVTVTFNATPNDGFVQSYKGSWNTVRGASAGGTVYDDIGAATFAMEAARYIFGDCQIARSFFSFPTAPLPDDCNITAVTFRLRSWTYASSVSVQKGTQADTLTTASYNDFSGSEYGHTSWGAGYNNITFNAQGIADISKTGITKLCAREYDHDYLSSEPDGIFDNGCRFSEKGEGSQPQLVVTYETSGPPTVTGNVTGEVRDVNANLLSNVLVSLSEHGGGYYDSDVASPDYHIEVDQTGEYWLRASKGQYFPINTSDMPPVRNPWHEDYIDFTTAGLLAAGYNMDFEGDYGLVPRACNMSYAIESINHWLFTPIDASEVEHPEWQPSNWKAMQSVHSWQFPS